MTAALTTQVDRVLLGEAATLSFAFIDRDEVAVAVAEPVSVTITDGDGEAVVTGAEATLAPDKKSAIYTLKPADFSKLDTYVVVWSATLDDVAVSWQTTLELCGGHLFSIASFKAYGHRLDTLTAAQIREIRRQAEDRFEAECGVAFVPRGGRAVVKADDVHRLRLPHVAVRELYAVTVHHGAAETVLTEAQLATLVCDDELVGAGIVYCKDGDLWREGDFVTLHYAHGYDRPAPHVADAVRKLATEGASPSSALPPRATSVSTDVGIFRISTASREHPTGIPDVDSVIELESRRRPEVG